MADNERVAVVIASREEKLLQITVTKTLEAATGDIEVIVILDGYEDQLVQEVKSNPQYDPRVRVIRNKEPIGQRASVNLGARSTDAKYFIKCDAHNLFGPGFDEILKADCEYDWTVIPRLHNLDGCEFRYHCKGCGRSLGEKWDQNPGQEKTRLFICTDCNADLIATLNKKENRNLFKTLARKTDPKTSKPTVPMNAKVQQVLDKTCVRAAECDTKPSPTFFTPKTGPGKTTDYMCISSVHDGKPYEEMRAWYHPHKSRQKIKDDRIDYLIDDMMVAQGACWFMYRQRFLDLGGLDDEGHGGWGQVGVEVACKAWLSGGRHVINKKTWFSHQFRGHMGGSPYPLKQANVDKARAHCRHLWVEGNWEQQVRPLSWLIRKFWPVPTWAEEDVKWLDAHCRRKAIVCINKPDTPAGVAEAARRRLIEAAGDIPIVDVDLQSDRPRDAQILAGIRSTKADTIYMAHNDVFYTPMHFATTIHTDERVVYNKTLVPTSNAPHESQAIGSRKLLEAVYGEQHHPEADMFRQLYPNIIGPEANGEIIPYWVSVEHAIADAPVPGRSLWDTDWYQVGEILGVPTPASTRSALKSPFYGQGRWETFIKPLLPSDNLRGRVFVDAGCNAGLNLIRAKEMGYGRAVGFEVDAAYCRQSEYVRLANGYTLNDIPVFHRGITSVTPWDIMPLADVTLLCCMHYFVDTKILKQYIDELAEHSVRCVIVSRDKERYNYNTPGFPANVRALFADEWDEDGQVNGLANDPENKKLYSLSFQSKRLETVNIDDVCNASGLLSTAQRGPEWSHAEHYEYLQTMVAGAIAGDSTPPPIKHPKPRGRVLCRSSRHWKTLHGLMAEGQRVPIELNNDGSIHEGRHRTLLQKALGQDAVFAVRRT